jgi:hypothetical protein
VDDIRRHQPDANVARQPGFGTPSIVPIHRSPGGIFRSPAGIDSNTGGAGPTPVSVVPHRSAVDAPWPTASVMMTIVSDDTGFGPGERLDPTKALFWGEQVIVRDRGRNVTDVR